MRLKKLEIVGFKSFLEKTSFDFTAEITGVVGPNGCGKSNIVDAIKWITGELSFKELRGRTMQDLIFAGSELRPPTSMAEVSLTLDNSDGSAPAEYKDFSDIQVVRRVFRDGTSEFFVNKTPCRLRDLIDIFLDTGVGSSSYSIIEQGRVGMVVASKPEDRRAIIEEAAGITKYKHRKKAAQRKMDYTRQNLLRVTDVLGELKRQINSLERQARKAQKFREVRDEARSMDLALSSRSYVSLRTQIEEAEGHQEQMAADVDQEQTELTALEGHIETARLDLLDKERQLSSAQQELSEHSGAIAELEKNIESRRAEIRQLKERADVERQRAVALSADRDRLEVELQGLLESTSALEHQRSEAVARLDQAASEGQKFQLQILDTEQEIEGVKDELLSVVAREAELKNQLAMIRTSTEKLAGEIAQRTRELERSQAELSQTESTHLERQKSLGVVVQLRFGFEREQVDLRKKLDDLYAQRIRCEAELSELSHKIEGQSSRLAALQEFSRTYQAYGEGVRAIMEYRDAPEAPVGRVLGLLGELVRPAKGYERAVEAILSDRLGAVLVETPRDALRAIEFLRERSSGRAAFLPRRVRDAGASMQLPPNPGVVGWLLSLVELDERCRGSLEVLLRDVILVDSLPRALALWEDGLDLTMVTPEGDLVSRHGMVVGGAWGDQRGALQVRREIDDLTETLDASRSKRTELETLLSNLSREIGGISSELSRVGEALSRESKNVIDHEKDFERLDESLRRSRQNLEVIQSEIVRAQNDRTQFENTAASSMAEITQIELRRISLDEEVTAFASKLTAAKEAARSHEEGVTELRLRVVSLDEKMDSQRREREGLVTRISNMQTETVALEEGARRHEQESQNFTEEVEAWTAQRAERVHVFEEKQKAATELRTEHDTIAEAVRTKEGAIRDQREKLDLLREGLSALRMKLQEEQMKLEHLSSQVFERYATAISEWVSSAEFIPIAEELVEETEQKLNQLREKIAQIGDVNLSSIEEVKQLEERFSFLTAQKDDLETSLNSLSEAIRKINSTTRERFIETYEAVNKRFQDIFPRLFHGGKAHLVLTDPENLLETGIEIVAQPPGKRLQSMNLLSGGEKALTAISLIFAIFQHKAPPFCLLDEVDAPLDDTNVRRFLGLLKEMSSSTQFIMITHNKASMETTQNLYGITMEEPGVSRVVSVRVSQMAAVESTPLQAQSVA